MTIFGKVTQTSKGMFLCKQIQTTKTSRNKFFPTKVIWVSFQVGFNRKIDTEKKKYLPYSCHHNQKVTLFSLFMENLPSLVSTSDLLVVGSKPGLTILFSIFFHKSITFLQGKNSKCTSLIMNRFYPLKKWIEKKSIRIW